MAESLDIFALAARYRPMLRLLDGSDFDLINDAGDRGLLRRIRTQRRAIFRGYLRSLRRDHGRLCSQLRALIVYSDTDQKDLAVSVMRLELNFQALMMVIHVRLTLHAAGLGTVTATPLMDCFERIRIQTERLSPAAIAA